MDEDGIETELLCVAEKGSTSLRDLARKKFAVFRRLLLHQHVTKRNSISVLPANDRKQFSILTISAVRGVDKNLGNLGHIYPDLIMHKPAEEPSSLLNV